MSLNVLSVDDSKTIRMIVRKAFSPFDCTVSALTAFDSCYAVTATRPRRLAGC